MKNEDLEVFAATEKLMQAAISAQLFKPSGQGAEDTAKNLGLAFKELFSHVKQVTNAR